MSDAAGERTYDLSTKEVEDFFDMAASSRLKSDHFLIDHYTGTAPQAKSTVNKLCELLAMAAGFQEYLEKTFKSYKQGLYPESAVWRIKTTHATAIVQMIFSITEIKMELADRGLSIEEH